MSERTINLPNGLEPMSEGDMKTIWNKADDARGDQAHLSDDVFDLVNALDVAYAQIDSLQRRVNGLNEESLANFRTAAERGKQLTERDRTISRLEMERNAFKDSFERWHKEAQVLHEKNVALRKQL